MREVGKEKIRPLVARHPARETDLGGNRIERRARLLPHELREVRLRSLVRAPDVAIGKLVRAHERFGLVLPLRIIRLIEGGEGGMGPAGEVGAGRDRVAFEYRERL